MDRLFHPTLYCNYLCMLGFKLYHVSKRGLCWYNLMRKFRLTSFYNSETSCWLYQQFQYFQLTGYKRAHWDSNLHRKKYIAGGNVPGLKYRLFGYGNGGGKMETWEMYKYATLKYKHYHSADNFHHRLHQKLSKWQPHRESVMTIWSKWWYFYICLWKITGTTKIIFSVKCNV